MQFSSRHNIRASHHKISIRADSAVCLLLFFFVSLKHGKNEKTKKRKNEKTKKQKTKKKNATHANQRARGVAPFSFSTFNHILKKLRLSLDVQYYTLRKISRRSARKI
jgi:hypothetical protein